MSYEYLCKEKKYFYRSVVCNVISSTELLEQFIRKWKVSLKSTSDTDTDSIEECLTGICESLSTICSHAIMVFEMIVKLFLKVIVAQFRKDYLRVIKKEKGLALRKKVVEKAGKNNTECVSIKVIKTDKSTTKQTSHFKLKAMVQSGKDFYSAYKKADLQLLLKAYETEMLGMSTKKDLGEKNA
ncbi:hypothetical protein DPMN_094652 [Dreissena polymorpha]|uniref:Uncharacterized protein n=1 Tax=Dreissena polymorpha TaxID=45954 RepID=A0A9D4L6I4_DREPO|nr:hypothetical protein DPMN_094652 [Dreissena polymorpha]